MSHVTGPVIYHHHGFKCAGTTFAEILERNFPGRVLYVEGAEPHQRLPWQSVAATIATRPPAAISSHLSTIPPRGKGIALLHVAFVRQPRARLVSAFLFQKRTNDPEVDGWTFDDYIADGRRREVSNYQTRHLSVQDCGGWQRRRGWEARPELVSFVREDLFIGVVERMDESLLVLERRLAGLQVRFDASPLGARNATPLCDQRTDLQAQIPDDMVELDDVLYERANVGLSTQCRRLGIDATAIDTFRARATPPSDEPAASPIPHPSEWMRLPVVLPAAESSL